jgi:endonuclease G
MEERGERREKGSVMDARTRFLKTYAERHLAVHMRQLPENQRYEVLAKIRPAVTTSSAQPQALPRSGKARVYWSIGFVLLVGCVFLLRGIWTAEDPYRHLPLGAPEAPVLLYRQAYALGYDPERKMASWISYRVQPGEVETPRSSQPDPAVSGSEQIPPDAFKGSPYNRSALIAPRHVTSFKGKELEETRYYTVFVPQSDGVFRSVMRVLDNRVLTDLQPDAEIWVIKGPVHGDQVPSWNGFRVPDAYFHIVLSRENGQWRVAAHLISNGGEASSSKLDAYKVSVDEIESQTGLDFFADLTDGQETLLEAEP